MTASVTVPSSEATRLVIVANRLPVEFSDGQWRRSPGGLVSALVPLLEERGGIWVGWSGRTGAPGTAGDGGRSGTAEGAGDDGPDAVDAAGDWLEDIGGDGIEMVEVDLDPADVADYYEGFANGAIWPLYHDVVATPVYHRHQFRAYQRVNAEFAAAAARVAPQGGTVWVQDYQLQMVPRMLRALRPDLRIGFFLHIPFPPAELFLQLPERRQILEGLLGADLVGFQTKDGARNFLALTERLLALRAGGDRVEVQDDRGARTVRVDGFPIGIAARDFDAAARRPEIRTRAAGIRAELGDPAMLLLGVDRLDYTKGIGVRLRAFAEVLAEGSLPADDVAMVQVATPSRQNVSEYRRIRDEVELQVGRINGDLGRVGFPAVHYLHQDMDRDELVAMYVAADVMVVTPLRDGMNLVCKEYVACRTDDTGALVLSEFTGAALQLTDAWLVNPYDVEAVKRALVDAAKAAPQERARRMEAMRHNVFENDVDRWAREFLATLEGAVG